MFSFNSQLAAKEI